MATVTMQIIISERKNKKIFPHSTLIEMNTCFARDPAAVACKNRENLKINHVLVLAVVVLNEVDCVCEWRLCWLSHQNEHFKRSGICLEEK